MNSYVKISKSELFRNKYIPESEELKIVTYCLKKHCFDHTKTDTANKFMKKLTARIDALS